MANKFDPLKQNQNVRSDIPVGFLLVLVPFDALFAFLAVKNLFVRDYFYCVLLGCLLILETVIFLAERHLYVLVKKDPRKISFTGYIVSMNMHSSYERYDDPSQDILEVSFWVRYQKKSFPKNRYRLCFAYYNTEKANEILRLIKMFCFKEIPLHITYYPKLCVLSDVSLLTDYSYPEGFLDEFAKVMQWE